MEIEKASLCHLDAFRDYVEKCVQDGIELYDGANRDSDAYLKKRIGYAEGVGLPEGWPPMSMYFYVDSGKILGAIRIRHGFNEYINNVIGHIGYETLPQARGKGIATSMLHWTLRNLVDESVIISCDINNIGSRKVIEKCGGKYLSTFYCDEKKNHIMRYQLKAV
ncbi:GNAT family N-acetyltransferase [Vibrio ostreae]|uniref:GNAT family N-acetyltransferase n=1 Tax=Vibrio ostreae TaxID=2841925 RepID=A0A975YLP3_9VIBR|nr:GNAT family N-acetyltransferase [Vibrio ostreae]QXO15857.1 GNAT family N-acetyltransferase [Vibrio ostreae]